MAKLTNPARIELEVTLTLNEAEIRALALLTEYKVEDTLKALEKGVTNNYAPNGREYAGMKSFLESMPNEGIRRMVNRTDEARKTFAKDKADYAHQ